MFDLYLGRPIHRIGHPDNINQGDVLQFAHRPFSLALRARALTVPIYSIVFALADDEMSIHRHVEREREGRKEMKTSSSKREQIDSDRLSPSPSFSRTII